MADYKWANHEQTMVMRYPGTYITQNGAGWHQFQEYLREGGEVDQYRAHEDWVEAKVAKLDGYYHALLLESDNAPKGKKETKLARLLRKEYAGTATPEEKQVLDDNDTLDDWYDAIETAKEDGEAWLEDALRTEQELIDFDPATDIVWPSYPL